MIGLLLTAVFSASSFGGVGFDEGMSMGSHFGVQVIGILATAVWCAIVSFVILKIINAIVPLRVESDEETEGLDLVLHEERGYIL